MATTTSEELEALVQSELAAGGYASREALLLAALRALREEREHLREFREQLAQRMDRLDRGACITLKGDAALHEFMTGLERQFCVEHGLDPDAE
jgi:Arc/MetJ-type ribon-helix-helix transcriptional regulator